jgi:uncharacterized protein (TIGR00255 family)
MTGYGQAEAEVNGVTYSVEIKTVNNRYLKTTLKLPDTASFLEDEIDKSLRQRLSRGTVNYALRVKSAPPEALFEIDEQALAAVIKKIGQVAASVGVNATVDIGSAMDLPNVVMPVCPDQHQAEQLRQGILEITGRAVQALRQMRAAEGAAMAEQLVNYCKAIDQHLDQIVQVNVDGVRQYVQKLRQRVDELLAQADVRLDEDTLAREVAVFAERSDISEEVARLQYHVEQFVESCTKKADPLANEQAGRRLEFISQEMLREANTMASKAATAEVSRQVVEVKCLIDRIKEQTANVE